MCVSPRWLGGGGGSSSARTQYTHTHTSHIDTTSLLLSLSSSSSPPFFLSGWMCPQVRVIFPLAQIRAELKSGAKVTALPPEILRQTPPPLYCAQLREHAENSGSQTPPLLRLLCWVPSFLVFPYFLSSKSPKVKEQQWHQLSFPLVFVPVCAEL